MDLDTLLVIAIAFLLAIAAIYALYSIILFKGITKKGDELQLTTKNVLEQVQILFDKHEYPLVELLATKYLDRVPGHLDVRLYLAKTYYETKKYNMAIQQATIVLKKRPHDPDTHSLLGYCYYKKGVLIEAIREFEQVFEYKPKSQEVVKILAELYRETDQINMALEYYYMLADITENNEENADIQSIIAELCEEVRDFPSAFEAYKSRLTVFPQDVDTNKKLAELYIVINNYPAAIETLEYMREFTTDNKMLLWIYEMLVELYEQSESYELAIERAESLVELQGSDKFNFRRRIATLKLKLDKTDEGITILEDLAMMSQNGFEVTLQLAEAYKNNKEYQKALDKYLVLLDKSLPKEAKIVNALVAELYVMWADELRTEQKYDEATVLLDSATQYNMLNSDIYYLRGQILCEQKGYANAIEQINKALEYCKDDKKKIDYLLLMADATHQLGQLFEEKKALTDLLKVDDKNAEGLFRLGLMFSAQNDFKNAEESYKKAIVYNPDLIQAKYYLGLLYEANNKDKAKELYMEVLEQDPTFIEARNALSDLSTI